MSTSSLGVVLVGFGRWGQILFRTILDAVPQLTPGILCTRRGVLDKGQQELLRSSPSDVPTLHVVDHQEALRIAQRRRWAVICAASADVNCTVLGRCISMGIPCFVEKPCATSFEQITALSTLSAHAIASKNHPVVVVDYTHLFGVHWACLRARCRGERIVRVASTSSAWGPFRADAGALWDWGSHHAAMVLDLCRLEGGEPVISIDQVSAEEQCVREGGQQACGSTWNFRLGFGGGPGDVRVSLSNLSPGPRRRSFEVALGNGWVWTYDEHGLQGTGPVDEQVVLGTDLALRERLPLALALRAFAKKCLGEPLEESEHERLFGLELAQRVTNLLARVEAMRPMASPS